MGYQEITTFDEYRQVINERRLSVVHFSIYEESSMTEDIRSGFNSAVEDPQFAEVDFYVVDNEKGGDVVSKVMPMGDSFTHVFKDGEKVVTLREPAGFEGILEALLDYIYR